MPDHSGENGERKTGPAWEEGDRVPRNEGAGTWGGNAGAGTRGGNAGRERGGGNAGAGTRGGNAGREPGTAPCLSPANL
ncbi:MAG: hypothetical protein DIJKHBIC_00697 [Thermoanaerobaculia bacterium]|nr:hypothetical protein [Thermoanaerobaculia bacterium]